MAVSMLAVGPSVENEIGSGVEYRIAGTRDDRCAAFELGIEGLARVFGLTPFGVGLYLRKERHGRDRG